MFKEGTIVESGVNTTTIRGIIAGNTRGFKDKGGGFELVLVKDEITGEWNQAGGENLWQSE